VTEPDEPATVRITVTLPIKVWRHVERIAAEAQCSKTEALRRCISVGVWEREVTRAGGRIYEEHGDPKRRVGVRFPW
jgi:hypothetical protein